MDRKMGKEVFKCGRSSCRVSLVGACLASLTPGAVWLGQSGEAVYAATPPDQQQKPANRFTADAPQISWAPYVWKRFGSDATARAEATMPGASVRWARTTSA